jgi:SRSO17 transposase
MTQNQMAAAQIRATVAAQVPRGVVLADAAYGDDCALRDELGARGLIYALGIRPLTTVGWGAHQPAPAPPVAARGRPRVRGVRDATHSPLSVCALAQALPARAYRTLTWRQGSAEPLSGRFARVRVVTAHDDRARNPEWLVIEWSRGEAEPLRYWLSTLPEETTFQALVGTLKGRWRIERDYRELKQELGLGHYEGRNWRGFHHHASLCIAVYGFLTLERLRGSKKNRTRFKAPAVPESFRPRGAGADAAASAVLNRDPALPARPRDCPTPRTMSLLQQSVPKMMYLELIRK